MTDQNGGVKDGGAPVTSYHTTNGQTRFSFYNAQDFVQQTTPDMLKVPTPRLELNPVVPNRDSVEILRSLQEHEQQRREILGAVGSSRDKVDNTSGKETSVRADSAPPNSSEASNPYEDAIKEALDLLRKHRTTNSQASTPAVSNTPNLSAPRQQLQQQWNDSMVALGTKTPPEADRILQSRTELAFFPENKQDAAAGYEPAGGTPQDLEAITPSAVALGEAYQAEIEARRKQRQERMARYATRLAELKQEDKYIPNNITATSEAGQAWTGANLDVSWNSATELSLTSRSVPNGFREHDGASGPAIGGDVIPSYAPSLPSKEDDVQRGVERVLLAILERANSQGRALGYDQTDALRQPKAATEISPWALNTSVEEKKAISPLESRPSIDSVDDGDNALIRAMSDLLGASTTSTLGSSSPNRTTAIQSYFANRSNSNNPNYPNGAERPHPSSPSVADIGKVVIPSAPATTNSNRKTNLTVDTSLHGRDPSPEDDLDKIVRTVLVQEKPDKQDDSLDRRVRSVLSPKPEPRSSDDKHMEDRGEEDYDSNHEEESSESSSGREEEEDESYDGNDDNANTHSDLDGLLGPLSKRAGVVLEGEPADTNKDSFTSASLLDSISAAVTSVARTLTSDVIDKYTGSDMDEETNDLMLSLCAHLLPQTVVHSLKLTEKRPVWDETNPDEAGYRIIRLSKTQFSSVESAFHRTVAKTKPNPAGSDGDDAFERDLKAAEEALDSHEKKQQQFKQKPAIDLEAKRILTVNRPLDGFPGVKSTGRGEMGDLEYFHLPIIFKSHVTGFEPTKDLVLENGNVVAGQYLVEGELGSAAFSTAYRCVDLSSDGDGPDGHEEVCLKVIKNTKDFFDQSLDEIKILELLRQTGMCQEMNLVEMKTFFYHREHLIIVTELLRQNLFEFGKFIIDSDEEPYFTMPRLSYLTRQILVALNFVHGLGLVHSDVKPENILLSSYSRAKAKLIDFGSSCFLTDRQSSYIQSRSYRAPEVILGLPYDGRIDIWSLGCVVAEMFTGEVTFQNDSVVSMLSRIESICGPFPSHMISQGRQSGRFFTKCGLLFEKLSSEDQDSSHSEQSDDDTEASDRKKRYVDVFQPKVTTLSSRLGFSPELMRRYDEGRKMAKEEVRQAVFVDFVRKLLSVDPQNRPSAAEALNHPWMKYAEALTEEEIKYPSA